MDFMDDYFKMDTLTRNHMFTAAKIYKITNDDVQKKHCKDLLINAYARLAVKWAKHYAYGVFGQENGHEYVEVLTQEGIIGLHLAIDKFEADRGVNFFNFADLIIRRHISAEAGRLNHKMGITRISPKHNSVHRVDVEVLHNCYSNDNDNITALEIYDSFFKSIEDIKEPYKTWIMQRYYCEMSFTDIAKISNTSYTTVRKHIKEHLPKIKEVMSKYK